MQVIIAIGVWQAAQPRINHGSSEEMARTLILHIIHIARSPILKAEGRIEFANPVLAIDAKVMTPLPSPSLMNLPLSI
jgi:hypothetical protein